MSDGGPVVLDASALLALLQDEPGADVVAAMLPGSAMSAVNLSEVVAKLADHGVPPEQMRAALDGLPIEVHAFDREAAYIAGELRGATRSSGLSLGDRACLALAIRLEATAVTSDRAWTLLSDVPVRVAAIR
jgi:ribonuclease VapC